MITWSLVLKHLMKVCPERIYTFETEWTLEDALTFLYNIKKMSLRQIVELTEGECSSISLINKMRELGIKLRKKGGPNYIKPFKVTKEEYKTMTYKELARKYNCHRATIWQRCKGFIETDGKKKKKD